MAEMMAGQAAPIATREDVRRGASSGAGGITTGRWSPGAVGALLIVLLLAATQLLIWVKAIEARGGPEYYVRGIDLMPTIAGGAAIRDGAGASLYDFAAQLAAQRQVRAPYLPLRDDQLLPYIHPPFEALAIVPLLGLPYPAIYALLTTLAIAAFGAACWFLARDLPVRGACGWVLFAAICAYHPLWQALWLGQTSPFVLLGIVGTYAALARHREKLAALPLLLIALKPQVFLVFALLILLLGHWRTLMVVAVAIAAACVAAIPFLGTLWPLRYAAFLAAIAGWDAPHAVYPASMPTLRGLLTNLLGGVAPVAATAAASLLALGGLAMLVWCWLRARSAQSASADTAQRRSLQRDLLWALTTIVAVLVPAHMGPHDHTILIVAAWIVVYHAVAGAWGRGATRRWYALLWAIFATILLVPFTSERPALVVVPTVLLLVGGVAALAWRIEATHGVARLVPRAPSATRGAT
jgi:hypothetical protein